MKKLLLFVCIGIATHAAAQQRKPNIVVFLVDDMGWQDCSVPFYKEQTRQNRQFRTPNMERLAAKGVKFTNAYANQNCTPSRVSLLTGMNAVNHGVSSWTFHKNKTAGEGGDKKFQSPVWNLNGLSPVPGIPNTVYATPLPQLLRQQGYKTIHVGKAHFGAFDTPGADPLALGFDVNIGGGGAGQPGSYLGLRNFGHQQNNPNPRAVPGLEQYWGKDIFVTEAITQEALKQLDSVNNKPFFLYIAQFAVHTPIEADNRFVQRYYNMGIDSVEARYAALVEGMDKSLGDIMDYLERKQLHKNTIIIFLSDNGGLTDVARGKPRNEHNSPLRSGKTSGYEGGLRIPMLAYWPGVTRPASVCTQQVIVEDVFTTVLSAAGGNTGQLVQKTDGLNIAPLLKGKTLPANRVLTWHFPHQRSAGSPDVQPFSAIRTGPFKLIYLHKSQTFELYNTDVDIAEQHNLAAAEPARVRAMATELGKRLKAGKAAMLVNTNTGKGVPYPDEAVKN